MRRAVVACAVAAIGMMAACGGGKMTPETPSGELALPTAASDGSDRTDIEGTITAGMPEHGPSVLVFVFDVSPTNANPLTPVGVAVIDHDGHFSVPGLPAGRFIVFFMKDDANDGVMDPQDPRTLLPDPQQLLQLRPGDHAVISNIDIDFASSTIRAATIDVTHASGAPTLAVQAGE